MSLVEFATVSFLVCVFVSAHMLGIALMAHVTISHVCVDFGCSFPTHSSIFWSLLFAVIVECFTISIEWVVENAQVWVSVFYALSQHWNECLNETLCCWVIWWNVIMFIKLPVCVIVVDWGVNREIMLLVAWHYFFVCRMSHYDFCAQNKRGSNDGRLVVF